MNRESESKPRTESARGNVRVLLSAELERALGEGLPVVALESTILCHGLPFPENLETHRASEEAVRREGAVPALVSVVDGVPRAGFSTAEVGVPGARRAVGEEGDDAGPGAPRRAARERRDDGRGDDGDRLGRRNPRLRDRRHRRGASRGLGDIRRFGRPPRALSYARRRRRFGRQGGPRPPEDAGGAGDARRSGPRVRHLGVPRVLDPGLGAPAGGPL